MTLLRSTTLATLVLLAACAPAPPAESREAPAIFLVRHAETEGPGPDPELSAEGMERAERLSELLAGAKIERVLSTPYRRTRATAAPLAARLGLEPEIYDPRRLAELATQLLESGETALVVGHSNTTPDLARRLGADPGSPIAEDEHDRLYRIDPATGRTTMTRFGGEP